MSELIVKVNQIDEVFAHPDPAVERLEMVRIQGWFCMVRKGVYKPGDYCLYIPVDAVLPQDLEDSLFKDAKIRPEKGRIRSIKFRGAVSQGLVVSLQDMEAFLQAKEGIMHPMPVPSLDTDWAARLGITKYEPPASETPNSMKGTSVKKKHPDFKEYTDISNIKWHIDEFAIGDPVYITEKLHGTSARYGMLPTHVNNGFKRFLKAVGLLKDSEFVYGSRRVQLDLKVVYDGFYGGPLARIKRAFNLARRGLWTEAKESLVGSKVSISVGNVYAKIAKQLDLKNKLKPGEVLYGEIVGPGIQKGYAYGLPEGQHEFYAYDVMVDGRFLDAVEFMAWCDERGVKRVPSLYVGGYDYNIADKLRKGDSTIGNQKIREGVVIKPYQEKNSPTMGRVVVKFISDDYYLQNDGTDFH